MGARSADIDREIRERRARISQRVEKIRWRAHDLRNVPGDVADKEDLTRVIQERPLLCVAGALGAGVLLGTMSERPIGSSVQAAAGSELTKGLIAAVESAAGDELRRVIGEVFGRATPETGGAPEKNTEPAVRRAA